MVKRFFISFLGSLTAIWLSVALLFVLIIIMAVTAVATSFESRRPEVNVNDRTVLRLDLSGTLSETLPKPSFSDLLNGEVERPLLLQDMITALRQAKSDSRILGLYIKADALAGGSASFQALRRAILDFKASGKWVAAYADVYTQGDYYIASAADSLWLNPVGMVDLRGLTVGVPFYKGLLDKLGVEMQVIKVGTFKSAVEPYILSSMSEPNRRQYQDLVASMWSGMTADISRARGVTPDTVNLWADSLLMCVDPKLLPSMKVVTGLKYQQEADKAVASLADEDKPSDMHTLPLADYFRAIDLPHQDGPKEIAVYYADGEIVDGDGDDGEIGADKVIKDLANLADDDDVAGVVLRVNSPGGSAFASEQIWNAVEQLKKSHKKVYVSMANYAASGGYYISCGADKIFAEPMTLTGSIGIYGMIPCLKGLLSDKLGVNFDYVTTNVNGVFPSLVEPMTPAQRVKMQATINRGYRLFTSRCAKGRHIPLPRLLEIAEGRVWSGVTAKKLGLVDELGGLDATVSALARDLALDKYKVDYYPGSNTSFWDLLDMFSGNMTMRAEQARFGSFYPLYKEVRSLASRNPVQARMELSLQY